MAGYYKRIKGKNYDRELIELADDAVAGKGDGRISLRDAKGLLAGVKDADSYTDIEKRTMKYIRDKYKFTKEADKWFRTEIRKWAGSRGSRKAKTKTKSKAKAAQRKKRAAAPAAVEDIPPLPSTIPEPSPVLAAEPQEDEGKEKTAFWKILWIIPLIIVLFLAYYVKNCKGKEQTGTETSTTKAATTTTADESTKKAEEKKAQETQKKTETTTTTPGKKTVSARQVTRTKIAFRKGKVVISKRGQRALKPVVTYLAENPGAKLTIIGHTCTVGGHNVNDPLSKKRADVVANYLTSQGASADQIVSKGMGQRKPIASNRSRRGRRKNRRVEFRLQ